MARIFSKKDDSFYYEVACRIDEMIIAETVGEMPSQQELKEMYTFSPEFERKMEELINGIDERRIIPIAVKRIIIVAAIIAALVFGALSASAIYKAVYNLYMACMGNHSVAVYSENGTVKEKDKSNVETFYEPSYMPEKYVETQRNNYGIKLRIYYSDGINEIVYTQSNIATYSLFDTEDTPAIYLSVGDLNACFIEKDDHLTFVWEEFGYCFSIEGPIPLDTAVYIAQNIKKSL